MVSELCGFLVIFSFFIGDPSHVILLLLLSVPIDGDGLCGGARTHEHEDCRLVCDRIGGVLRLEKNC